MTELETRLLTIISDIRHHRVEAVTAYHAAQKLRDELAEEEKVIADCKFEIRVLEYEMEDIITQLRGED